jgi:hypothetical protein
MLALDRGVLKNFGVALRPDVFIARLPGGIWVFAKIRKG